MSEVRLFDTDFEPEIILPDNPLDAARTFLGVLAYPERNAGQPGQLGSEFTAALWNYLVWNGRKEKGLQWIREKFGDEAFRPPQKREFEGALNRGFRRIKRRAVANALLGTQFIRGFFEVGRQVSRLVAEGRADEAYVNPGAAVSSIHPTLWEENIPSVRSIIRSNLASWSNRFELNKTGVSASEEQRITDIYRRAYLPSRPVLHMAFAFDQVLSDIGPTLDGWDDWDYMLVLLWHPEKWIWQAIENANSWQAASKFHFTPDLEPGHMVILRLPEKMRNNAI